MYFYNNTDLYHHGIKGQKWGVRRFQNEDGSLTRAGKLHEMKDEYKAEKKRMKADRKEEYKKIQNDTSIGQKLLYNNATRKRAAKYVVDNNMSLADATKKAKGDAKRNTAILLGTYGAMAVGSIVLAKKMGYL